LKNLSIFAAAKNCFKGKLPITMICQTNQTLQTLVLDGLHAQTSCEHEIFSGIGIHTYYATNGVLSTNIPECLLRDMAVLEELHISGNVIRGTLLGNVEIVSKSLQTLDLSNNRLIGTIPNAIQQHQWIDLDLSFNKFTGTLNDQIYVFQAANSSLHLQSNRLSGSIPSQLVNALNTL
jgi:hypothetical protein